ncbi:hypothetical protein FRC06_004706, partial [Ceratobasidium sp. 370]
MNDPSDRHESGDASRFRHAASCLAQAAVSLSAAAQAMSSAAEALSVAIPQFEDLFSRPLVHSGETVAPSKPGTSSNEPATHSLGVQPNSGLEPAEPMESLGSVDYQEQDTSIDDNDYYPSDEDEEYIYALLKRQEEEKIRQENIENPPAATIVTHPSRSPSAQPSGRAPVAPDSGANPGAQPSSLPFSKRILVQREADVVLIACALSQRFDKVFCYMHYPGHSLPLYRKIFKDVNKTFVYLMTNLSPDWLLPVFENQKKAVLLLHETFRTPLPVKSTDSFCIIHVGWPRDAERYLAQTRFQNTQNSVLVAYSGDQTIYPACSKIMSHTTPWPNQDYVSLRKFADTLRPRLNFALSSVSLIVKEKAYTDWIEAYGRGGPRYVPSWTPSMLVQRANVYLLECLRYGAHQPGSNTAHLLEQPLPQVSAQFVKQNGLESAAQAGLMQVIQVNSGLNLVSDLPKSNEGQKNENIKAPSMEASGIATGVTQAAGSTLLPSSGDTSKTVTGAVPTPLPQTQTVDSVPAPAQPPQKYSLILRDEFDILPTACAIIRDYDKVICYVTSSVSSLAFIKRVMHGSTNADIIVIKATSPIELTRVSNEFNAKKRAVLLLTEDVSSAVVSSSPEKSCMLHMGWPKNYNNLNQYRTNTTILVACMRDADIFPSGLKILSQMTPYPNRADFEAQTLPAARVAVDSLLEKESIRTKEQLYTEWIEDHGPHGRRRVLSWTPITLALRANDYLLNVLWYHPSATSSTGALPLLWAGFVERNGLQKAVEAGILNIVSAERASGTGDGQPAAPKSNAPSGISSAMVGTQTPRTATPQPSTSATRTPDPQKPGISNVTPTATHAIVRDYFMHQDEFEVIPSICRLAKSGKRKNAICFVTEISVFEALTSLISGVVAKPVLAVVGSSPDVFST